MSIRSAEITSVEILDDKVRIQAGAHQLGLPLNVGVLVEREGSTGISLAKNLKVGDVILDLNPEPRRPA